ncbi:MAG: dockerin type I repeat-containing protein [Ruminococcus sp.]|nr:dockerin type I repeat-containing protein [Ruminococcus sp.]
MKFNRILSALTAALIAVPCMCIPQVSALTTGSSDPSDYTPAIFVPDFPQKVLDEFQIDWTGLGFNRIVEPAEFSIDNALHKFSYEGGYAMYGHQNELRSPCIILNWYDCDNFSASQTKDFPTPAFYSYNDPKIACYLDCEVKKEGELKIGIMFTLNGGKTELFVIDQYSDSTVFPEDEKIGSYTSEGSEYTLYKEASEDADTERYYAVRSVIHGRHEDYELNINDHLSALSEQDVKIGTLDKYTTMICGKQGRGNVFFNTYIKTNTAPLPSEKPETDEEGHPVTYYNNIVKNLDGTYYSFRTSDNAEPITELPDGRYEMTPHEDNSWFTPRGNGVFSTQVSEGMTSAVLAGREFEEGTSLDDHNFRLNYEYTISNDDVYPAAVVWLSDPSRRIVFTDQPVPSIDSMQRYIGTISLPEGEFELYSSADSTLEISPDGERPEKEYRFVRKTDGKPKADENGMIKGSFPIYALIKAASKYEVESGDVRRITFGTAQYNGSYKLYVTKNEIVEDEVSVLDEYDPSKTYSVVTPFTNIQIPPYCYYLSGNSDKCSMTAYDNGCFSGKASGDKAIFNADYNNNMTYDPYHDIVINYDVERDTKDDHDLMYALYVSDSVYSYPNITVYIYEENEGLSLAEHNHSFPPGMGFKLTDDDFEFVKTYKANGHEYDLYYNSSTYYGCFNTETSISYVCVRKDKTKGDTIKGTISAAEHIKQIDELAGKSFNISTAGLFITETNGSVEVLKNEISNPLRDEPEIIAGDINLDCCIDSFDVICAKKALIKGDEPNKNLDVNKNGTFEVADVVMLQSYVLGKISDFS